MGQIRLQVMARVFVAGEMYSLAVLPFQNGKIAKFISLNYEAWPYLILEL